MRSPKHARPCSALTALTVVLLSAGCLRDAGSGTGSRDFAVHVDNIPDLYFFEDLLPEATPDPCGDWPPSPECRSSSWGPGPGEQPLPMPGDVNVSIGVAPDGVRRDSDGAIVVDKGATGMYSLLLPGCIDQGQGVPIDTLWWSIDWAATVPEDTDLVVSARAASSPDWQSPLWASAQRTPLHKKPRIDLQAELHPNLTPQDPNGQVVNNQYLRVDVAFRASLQGASPRLTRLEIAWKCNNSVGGLRRPDRNSAAAPPQPRR